MAKMIETLFYTIELDKKEREIIYQALSEARKRMDTGSRSFERITHLIDVIGNV